MTVSRTPDVEINYAANMPGPDSAVVTATSGQLVAENKDRKGFVIQNIGNRDIFLAFGNAAEADNGIRLVRDQFVPFTADLLPNQAINAITSSGTSAVIFQEFA